ncbi:MAG: hypothetical protein M1830_005650 [Pleopsidium flavum]|nr:MAG: hypothetical protein M1830_005650 [Pleopsidium flavum]
MEAEAELLNIELFSSDEESAHKTPSRDYQSFSNFQKQKESWKPKLENGEIWKTIRFPLKNPSKPEGQTVLYAIEELYFHRRYEEGVRIADQALAGSVGEELRKTLRGYRERCAAKQRQA